MSRYDYGDQDRYRDNDRRYDRPRQQIGYTDRGSRDNRGGYRPGSGEPRYGIYPPPPPPPPPARNSRTTLFAVLGVLAVVMGACAVIVSSSGGGSGTGTSGGAAAVSAANSAAAAVGGAGKGLDHAEDVSISACAPDEAGWAAAAVTVTNHSSKSSNYAITVTMESPDGKTQIGTGLVAVNGLAPGQQAIEDTSSLKDAPSSYVCKVTEILRYAA